MISAIYVQRSICDCGVSVLYDSVPLGRSYQVDPASIIHGGIFCVCCGARTWCDLIQTHDGGWLPLPLLELEAAQA